MLAHMKLNKYCINTFFSFFAQAGYYIFPLVLMNSGAKSPTQEYSIILLNEMALHCKPAWILKQYSKVEYMRHLPHFNNNNMTLLVAYILLYILYILYAKYPIPFRIIHRNTHASTYTVHTLVCNTFLLFLSSFNRWTNIKRYSSPMS